MLGGGSSLLARLASVGTGASYKDGRSVLSGHRDGILCMDVKADAGPDHDQLVVTGALDKVSSSRGGSLTD